nr:MAG TPA: hypothetical protein [Caudoviricetes sp.]
MNKYKNKNYQVMKNYTPEKITSLKENEIFVFGSNLNGNHAGGAAYLAVEKFGAQMGNPEGIQGQSYAIPTLDKNMDRINLTDLEQSICRFYQYAEENPGKVFYMTKIGCGIAGYELSDIATVVNCRNIPDNVIIPEEFTHIPGYKGFDENMQCRGFQYQEGNTYHEDGNIEACQSGFHFCKYPLDVFNYYSPAKNNFCNVEGFGKVSNDTSDTKVAVSDLKVKAEIGISGLVKAAIEYTRKRCTNKCNAKEGEPATAGYSGAATAGSYGAATAGYRGAATAGNSGAATAGDRGAATAGSYGAATSRGKSCTGENGLSVARGNNVRVRGGMGAILVIAEENEDNYNIASWKAVVVDGVNVKPDTWYMLQNGELVEDNNKN